MSCSGLHCAGCGAGVGVPAAALAGLFGAAWVAEHLVEVAVVSAACGVLSVAAVVWLMRWQDRRQARIGPLMVTRGNAPAVTAAVIPRAVTGPRPAVIEQHVHFHGLTDDAAAAVIRRGIEKG